MLRQAIPPHGKASTDRSIATMDVGEKGWTVPWAMYHDKKRQLWLNGSYTVHTRPWGTVKMLVRRDDAGWHVDTEKVASGFQLSEAGYTGNFQPIRVATFNASENPGP